MNATSSVFATVELAKYYASARRDGGAAKAKPAKRRTNLYSGWTEAWLLVITGLAVFGFSLLINRWPF